MGLARLAVVAFIAVLLALTSLQVLDRLVAPGQEPSATTLTGWALLPVTTVCVFISLAYRIAERRHPHDLAPARTLANGDVFHPRWPWEERIAHAVIPVLIGAWGLALTVVALVESRPEMAVIGAVFGLLLAKGVCALARDRRIEHGVHVSAERVIDETISGRQEVDLTLLINASATSDNVTCAVETGGIHRIAAPLHRVGHGLGEHAFVIDLRHVLISPEDLEEEIIGRAQPVSSLLLSEEARRELRG